MRVCVGVLVLLACVAGARGAAPFVQRPAMAWTGTIEAYKGQLHGFALSPDGHTLVTTCEEKVAVWDLRTGKLVRERLQEEYEFSARATVFVNGGKELGCECLGAFVILDLKTLRTRTARRKVGVSGVSRLAASQDGAYAAGARSKTLAVWDIAKRKLLWNHEFEKEGNRFGTGVLAFSPDGKILAVGVDDPSHLARLYDVSTGRELRRLPSRKRVFRNALVFSRDGRWLATACESHFDVWDVKTGGLIRRVEWQLSRRSLVRALALSSDGKTLFLARYEGMRLYETASWGLRQEIDRNASAILPAPGGRLVWTSGEEKGRVHVDSWREPGQVRRLTDKELARLWDDLGSKDAEKGFRAITELLGAPEQAIALLTRLPRVELTRKQLDRLIADLDDEELDTRERASAALKLVGHPAEAILRAALAADPSAEVKRRIGKLLKAIDPTCPERLRELRGVEVLEALATTAARKQLERLAGGAEGAELTQDAKAALARVRKRTKQDEG